MMKTPGKHWTSLAKQDVGYFSVILQRTTKVKSLRYRKLHFLSQIHLNRARQVSGHTENHGTVTCWETGPEM